MEYYINLLFRYAYLTMINSYLTTTEYNNRMKYHCLNLLNCSCSFHFDNNGKVIQHLNCHIHLIPHKVFKYDILYNVTKLINKPHMKT
jgi:hypothetical protein